MSVLACQSHVLLPKAPAVNGPIEERVRYYSQYRPRQSSLTQVTYTYGGMPLGTATNTNFVMLESGHAVVFAEDLLPAVPATSPAALAAIQSESDRKVGQYFAFAGLAVALIGAGIALEPLASGDDDIPLGQVLGGTGLTLFGGLGLAVTGLVFRGSSDQQREIAFAAYEPSLRIGLNLCEQGAQIVPCGAP